ncbi:killer toxin, Kp4/SMK-like protein, core [Hypoxylon trugodes]|uniref:killer toxin, Kp4/SMK-like protein, core n=1 Tax=Hypoxylon trugodes TaxID=326681 RepID=UPI0021A21A6B|nr:killer toxin, Kp4/SMK-like protein, core [Hypoxylon trugodes]KAI1392624.1 killer toxin, Kp4/SMK-like protein, core [Hypoxylon trugodes]
MYCPLSSKAIMAIFAIASTVPQVTSKGINCQGSALCSTCPAHTLSEINTSIQGLSDTQTFPNGAHIACSGHCCAFLQNVQGTKTGAQIKGFVGDLLAHGCGKCGSDPTEPGNNVNTGELTVNYVSDP